MSAESDALCARTQQTLVDFLALELALGLSFARSALSAHEAGHIDHYNSAKKRATEAADSVRRFMNGATDAMFRTDIGPTARGA